jgi:soluble lytic murein transglycosylase
MDWDAVRQWIQAMPADERASDHWRYWEARATEATGEPEAADRIFAKLAGERSYYGFLAADRLSLPYTFRNEAITYTDAELVPVAGHDGIRRARELFILGLTSDARREWQHATAEMDERTLQLAAVVAHQWGWHDRAILTVARGKHFNDLDLRFPIVYHRQVETNAERYKVDPAWVFGVLRQESAFMADARSHAGAMGLMQLMPSTARSTARLINSPLRRTGELYNADKNIRLGTAHLRQVLDLHDGNHMLATAAYNAGAQRVKQWRPDSKMAADIWAETVPFSETRTYIRRVLAYTAIFENRMGRQVTSLRKRMPDVAPAS